MAKTCLVLEGGGVRGAYTCGVLDAFLDNNINIKSVYGVSAGALNGLSYLSRQKGRSLTLNKMFIFDERCINYRYVLKGKSIVNLDYLFDTNNETIEEFDLEEFNKRDKFVVTCTNVVTGNPVYKEIKDYNQDLPYIKASASLPLFSKIVEIDGLKLLDGGISDSIPILKAINDGYDKIVVVLTQDKEFMASTYKLMKAYKTKYFAYPNLIKTMENRFNKYNVVRDLIVDLQRSGKVLAIYPSEKLVIKNLEKDENKIDHIYNLGYADACKNIDQVKKFIGG